MVTEKVLPVHVHPGVVSQDNSWVISNVAFEQIPIRNEGFNGKIIWQCVKTLYPW